MDTPIPASPDTPPTPAPATPAAPPMTPIAAAQRIEALDVARGFALIGIFLMNIEWFSRPFISFNEGMPRGLTGLDWLASWFVAYFVQGKFWTIFSLLFGMGFAVMMVRAEQAGREFNKVYLRRVLALAVFGAAHYIFLWDGDILFTYAVSALMLMVALHARVKPLLIAIAVVAGLGFIPEMDGFFAVASGLATTGLIALFLRSEKLISLRGRAVPIFSLILLTVGAGLCIAAVVLWLLPDGPTEARLPLSVFGPTVLLAGWLSWKYRNPVELRPLRLGASLYLFAAISMTLAGVAQHFSPDPNALPAPAAQQAAAAGKAASAASMAASALAAPAVAAASTLQAAPAAASASTAIAAKEAASTAASAAGKKADEKPKKTKEERAAERRAEREKRLAEQKEEKAKQIRIYSTGTYAEVVDMHARGFVEKAVGDFASSMLFIGVFLIGVWLVRSGVMENTAAHLPLFHKLALYALPLGIALGLAGSMIAMHHTPGDRTDGWGIARGLNFIGNLPACLGYLGLVVTLLHSKTFFSRISVLAAPGRMALTNYLMQSLICAIYFYGYALGNWGMPRAQQVVFVAVVYGAQIAFSHWWLSKFRYGPMEWFWRGFTYRQVPKFRL